jgi:hypothetical protein
MSEKEEENEIEGGAFLESRVGPCNCTGEGGLQIHLSKTATAFMISLLDQQNETLFKSLDPDSKKMILEFGQMIAADIKMSVVTGHGVERSERKIRRKPEFAITLGDLLSIADKILGDSPIDTRPNMN